MKYIRYKTLNNDEYVGVLKNKIIYRLDYSCIIDAIRCEKDIKLDEILIKDNLDNVKILTPTTPSKIICIGLNYNDHANELEMEIPKEPLLFMKPSTSIIAYDEFIKYPSSTKKLDYEGELGIVILNKVSYDNFNENCIAGYTIVNDITARDLQEKDGQWTRSKSFDTFCPCGPVVSTNIDENNLIIKTEVNGNIKQNSNTKNMIFSPLELVKYISNIMTLNPGDIIATGTPPGVGHLQKDDIVVVTIENIGSLKNMVK